MTDKKDKNNNYAPKTSNVISATQPIFVKPFLDVSKIDDVGKNVCPPFYTCRKSVLHLRLLNQTQAWLWNKLMIGFMQIRYVVTSYSVRYLMICSMSMLLTRKQKIFEIPLSSNILLKTSSDKGSWSKTTIAKRWSKAKTSKSR